MLGHRFGHQLGKDEGPGKNQAAIWSGSLSRIDSAVLAICKRQTACQHNNLMKSKLSKLDMPSILFEHQ